MHLLSITLKFLALGVLLSLAGCSSVNVVVDTSSIRNPARFDRDSAHCVSLARNYDLNQDKLANTALGAGSGAVATVGLATAIMHVLYVPSAPYMAAGALGGGGMGIGWSSYKENAVQEKIITQCLNQRGYRTYSAE